MARPRLTAQPLTNAEKQARHRARAQAAMARQKAMEGLVEQLDTKITYCGDIELVSLWRALKAGLKD